MSISNRTLKKIRKEIMFYISLNLQYTINRQPLQVYEISISKVVSEKLRVEFGINGRFRASYQLEQAFELRTSNAFGNEIIRVADLRFRVKRSKATTINEPTETFSNSNKLVIKFIRIN